jgi:hypothetical protein
VTPAFDTPLPSKQLLPFVRRLVGTVRIHHQHGYGWSTNGDDIFQLPGLIEKRRCGPVKTEYRKPSFARYGPDSVCFLLRFVSVSAGRGLANIPECRKSGNRAASDNGIRHIRRG